MRNKYACVSDPNSFVSNPGSRVHIIYDPKVLPSGEIALVESGKEDIQEFINSFRDQTDMAYILKQMALGNGAVLTNDVPQFGDFTQMPKTYAEALQMVIDGKKKFDSLPLDVRNKFDNDSNKWLASSGSEDWLTKMDSVIKVPNSDVTNLSNSVEDSKENE